MTTQIAEKLKNLYLNKICTILTQQVAVPIQSGLQHAKYFTGRFIDVDNYGVYLESVQDKTISFFSHPVVGIVEEYFIPEKDPKAQEIKKELTKKNSPPDLIPVDKITEKLKSLKLNS